MPASRDRRRSRAVAVRLHALAVAVLPLVLAATPALAHSAGHAAAINGGVLPPPALLHQAGHIQGRSGSRDAARPGAVLPPPALPAARVHRSLQAAPDAPQQQKQQQQQQEQEQQGARGAQQLTPAQAAVARWREQRRQHQQGAGAGGRAAAAAAPQPQPPAPGEFVIPVPPPGVDVPAETQMPLYSPDQLRVRHKLIPGVPPEGQVISLGEQMQQAAALGLELTKEQLEGAYPLLAPTGPVDLPARSGPADFPDGYLALCAIVKDQAAELREWLEYHRWLGVGRVYVYDNNSTVPLAGAIADLLQSGFVEYAYFPGAPRYRDLFRTSSQWWAYNDCVARFRHRHAWLGFIDVDEFIVLKEPRYAGRPGWRELQQQQQQQQAAAAEAEAAAAAGGGGGKEDGGGGGPAAADDAAAAAGQQQRRRQQHPPDINAFMQQYERYGGLALNWVIFGSSGHRSRPRGGVLVNYHACLPGGQEQNTHVKVIANTRHLLTVGDDPHHVIYRSDKHFTVNELGQRLPSGAPRTAAPSHTKVALHHYLTKSEAEYAAKMARGSAAGNYKAPEFFATINALANATCTAAIPLGLRCCPSVAAELGPAGARAARQRLAGLRAAAAAGAGGAAAARGGDL